MIKKTIKAVSTAILSVASTYFLYAIISSYIMWRRQPRFTAVATTATNTVGMGFIVQLGICAGIFLAILVALIICIYFFYLKKAKPDSKKTKEQ